MPRHAKPKLAALRKKLVAPASKRPAAGARSAAGGTAHAQRECAAHGLGARRAAGPGAAPVRGKSLYGFDFSADDTVLLVGEGNFSFAASLAEKTQGAMSLTATGFDPEEVVREKYPDSAEHLSVLADLGAEVLFGVDATNLAATKALKGKRFTKAIFNFPHVGMGIKDQDRNVRQNQILVGGFLHSVQKLLTSRARHRDAADGLAFVTLKTGPPYDLWEVKALARSVGLRCLKSFVFDHKAFPRYSHRRTIGFAEGLSADDNSEITKRESRTYAFILEDAEDGDKKKKKKSKGEDDDDDDDDDDFIDADGGGADRSSPLPGASSSDTDESGSEE
ncbi:hypothetical protein HK105_205031 [Polyrhizophydium stewartii]|uniref:25S rRNA (uridine-N(3))-methyltransferase BMT5-like domain-containing protein n=1 Tax=Polyrhizophydium stewartii TaxID=2732419 RepID=A0ABR4N7A6_9FUNG|nr:hypothetical protein HK105_000767 [Polyrhizophydium stewartii]